MAGNRHHSECGLNLMVTGEISAGRREWSDVAKGGSRVGDGSGRETSQELIFELLKSVWRLKSQQSAQK